MKSKKFVWKIAKTTHLFYLLPYWTYLKIPTGIRPTYLPTFSFYVGTGYCTVGTFWWEGEGSMCRNFQLEINQCSPRFFLSYQLSLIHCEFARIKIHTLETPSSCTHEVAVPPSCPFQGLVDPAREPAKTYPFTLGTLFFTNFLIDFASLINHFCWFWICKNT